MGVLLFDGSDFFADLVVVVGWVWFVGVVGEEGVVLFCLGYEEGLIVLVFGVCSGASSIVLFPLQF